MILDTSALVAILYREPEAEIFTRLIHDADRCLISEESTELDTTVAARRCRKHKVPSLSPEVKSGLLNLSKVLYQTICESTEIAPPEIRVYYRVPLDRPDSATEIFEGERTRTPARDTERCPHRRSGITNVTTNMT
jgi:hypothetical protein